jgi:hypothetical protein
MRSQMLTPEQVAKVREYWKMNLLTLAEGSIPDLLHTIDGLADALREAVNVLRQVRDTDLEYGDWLCTKAGEILTSIESKVPCEWLNDLKGVNN